MKGNLVKKYAKHISEQTIYPIIIIDAQGTIVDANNAFYIETGYKSHELKAVKLQDIFQKKHSTTPLSLSAIFKPNTKQIVLRDTNGNQLPFWLNTISLPQNNTALVLCSAKEAVLLKNTLKNTHEEMINSLEEHQNNLKKISAIISAQGQKNEKIFHRILKLGCELLNLETGIISKVYNNNYTLLYLNSPLDVLEENSIFELENTYCHTVVEHKSCVYYQQVGKIRAMRSHPVYQNLKLESYIGMPLYLDNKLYGTLNFSSQQIKPKAFSWHELELIKLLASITENHLSMEKARNKEKKLKDKLNFLASYDPLTSALNRNGLDSLLKKYNKKSNTIGVLFIDIDHFKKINDTYGHNIGDKALRVCANKIKKCVSSTDHLARLGGDEFLLLMENVHNKTELEKIATRILDLIRSEDIVIDGKPISLKLSLGGTYTDHSCSTIQKLIQIADTALYAAKKKRNCFRFKPAPSSPDPAVC